MDFMTLRIADLTIRISPATEDMKTFCRDYLASDDDVPDITVTVTDEDIAYERTAAEKEAAIEGNPVPKLTRDLLARTAYYRKIAETLPDYDACVIHASAVAVDGSAFLFTAKSGTGKTTHTHLWQKNVPGTVIVNGDKPILRKVDGVLRVYGTPWAGKENEQTNVSFPVCAVSEIVRDETNYVENVAFSSFYPLLIQQIYRPKSPVALKKTLALLAGFGELRLYRTHCNMEDSAATVAYRAMTKQKPLSFEEVLDRYGVLIYHTIGVSMRPLLRANRDAVAIRKTDEFHKNDAVLFRRDNGQYVLHRITKIRDGKYYIIGDNCVSGEWVRRDQILGTLESVARGKRTIHSDDFLYRVYVATRPLHIFCLKMKYRAAILLRR